MAAAPDSPDDAGIAVRVTVDGSGASSASTGLPVLDHLIGLLTRYAGFDVALEIAPGRRDDEVAVAGRALGRALHAHLHVDGVRGYGSAVLPVDEALAHVTLEASEQARVVSNVDLSDARVGGLDTDLVARFLDELAAGAGLTLHVRLLDGDDTQHVLEAIFKALGVSLAQACRPRRS